MSYGHRPGRSSSSTGTIFHVLVVVLLILFVINTFYLMSISSVLEEKVKESREGSRLAALQVIMIESDVDCPSCDPSVLNTVDPARFDVTSEKILKSSDEEAQDLIEKYGIERLPAVLVFGELEKSGLSSVMVEVDDALLAQPTVPPYVESSGKVRGMVKVMYVKADDCEECFDLTPLVAILSQQIQIEDVVELDEEGAADLIEKYNLETLPVLILDEEASLYDGFAESWENVGTVESDGSLVLRDVNPPFKDLESVEVKGLVKVTYISDESCGSCYDLSLHDTILMSRLGVFFAENETVDVSTAEGKRLLDKYNITAVPTVILSEEIKDYQLDAVLSQVGDFTDAGEFVFRELQAMGTHRDLESGEIVEVQTQ